jgi:hypothetical protein
MTEEQKLKFDLKFQKEWRELGFFYDLGETEDKPEWRFFGSKDGLKSIIKILDDYIKKPTNKALSEHEHYGPYTYFTIMTWNKPIITDNHIAGTLKDLANLEIIISERLSKAEIGDVFNIGLDYGIDNTVDAKFFVMENNFDPASMDNFVWFDSDKKNE